ncbi:DUF4136 domain-containing protein [Echinimonas agarilytica]|uniref:DUF4136 domain-containing protein n=1 Tax=Echinimonas agarilytica TaxID=1215918 RepID=A0AA41W4Y4_9GAMM|nr:DUF4136 domain-containing protein [Echinimonas agarilytica]MCM2679054.1 DUF4136 domain-containing protein [Echinimonas agarilytica]
MKKFLTAAIAAIAILAAGCASKPNVNSDYAEDYDFLSIRSFYMVPINNDTYNGQPGASLAEQRITKSIVDSLTNKGLTQVSREEADVLVSFHLASKDKTRIRSYNTTMNYGYYGRYRYGGMGVGMGNDIDVQQYTEGQLLIDLVDRRSNNIIWRGIGKKKINERSTADENIVVANEYVNALFSLVPTWGPAAQ